MRTHHFGVGQLWSRRPRDLIWQRSRSGRSLSHQKDREAPGPSLHSYPAKKNKHVRFEHLYKRAEKLFINFFASLNSECICMFPEKIIL